MDNTDSRRTTEAKPTDAQLNRVYLWLKWVMPTAKAAEAAKYLEQHATRKQVSEEMSRLKGLKDRHALGEATAFDSAIWEGFDERFI